MEPASALSPLLAHANTIVLGIAKDTAKEATEDAVQQLKSIVFAITSAGRHHKNLSADEQTAVWELVCLLWVSACMLWLQTSHSCWLQAVSLLHLVTSWKQQQQPGFSATLLQYGKSTAFVKLALKLPEVFADCRTPVSMLPMRPRRAQYRKLTFRCASLPGKHLTTCLSHVTSFASAVYRTASTDSVQDTSPHQFMTAVTC